MTKVPMDSPHLDLMREYEEATGSDEISMPDFEALMNGTLKLHPSPEALMDLPTLESRAVNGDVKAQARLGADYHLGLSGVKPDNEIAKKWLLMAAQQGDVASQSTLVAIQCRPSRNPKNQDCAPVEKWLLSAAEHGNRRNAMLLQNAYSTGQFGLQRDAQKSCYAGVLLMDIMDDVEPKERHYPHCGALEYTNRAYAKVNELYLAQANQGLVAAQWHLGRSFEMGRGVPHLRPEQQAFQVPDMEQAWLWYGIAAKSLKTLPTDAGKWAEERQNIISPKLTDDQRKALQLKIDDWTVPPKER